MDISNVKKSSLFTLYIVGFLLAFSSAIPAYINSSFLNSLVGEKSIGLFYSIGSVLSLITLIYVPKLLIKYGNYKTTVAFSVIYFLNLLGLAIVPNRYVLILLFLISGSISTIMYFNLDIFIEHDSSNINVGRIRSIYLTAINLAWLASPYLAGNLVGQSTYSNIYLAVAIITLPIILIISSSLKNFHDPEYKTFSIIHAIKEIELYKDVEHIIFSSLILQFFYSWMIVYTPIYLNQYIGFDWTTIGIIFSIALLPFVLIQIPLGYVADKWMGEKEILTLGFIIMGVSTAVIPLIKNNSIFVWATLLFITRVGAAMVEVMSDTYFFKKVNDQNLNVINLYRSVSPVVYIISPIIATLVIHYTSFSTMFYILGVLMFLGLRFSLSLHDTK